MIKCWGKNLLNKSYKRVGEKVRLKQEAIFKGKKIATRTIDNNALIFDYLGFKEQC